MSDLVVTDPRPSGEPSPSGHRRTNRRSSILVTVSLVLLLLSIAFAAVQPAYQRHRREARAHATLVALQRFQVAFQDYASRRGNWPVASAGPGEIPPGMESALRDTVWSERTPIGGRFIWLTNTLERGERIHAAIAIVTSGDDRVSDDVRQLHELERQAASVHLDEHRLRFGFRNEPLYVLEH